MKIFLAGTYPNFELVKKYKPNYILETFYSLQNRNERTLDFINFVKQNTKMFLLDSGAFTIFNTKVDTPKSKLDEYVEKYAKFVVDFNIKYFFEMDVDYVFGLEVAEEYRRFLERTTKKKPIPVWHKTRGLEYWDYMINNYKYVAIGGLVTEKKIDKEKHLKLLNKMVLKAHQKGVKVHGLGFTKLNQLRRSYFDSVDSTSWVLNAAYAGRYVCDVGSNTIKVQRKQKNMRGKYKKLVEDSLKKWIYIQKKFDMKGE